MLQQLLDYINEADQSLSLKATNNKPCPDMLRLFVQYKDNQFKILSELPREYTSNKIIFILESPHKDEFDKNKIAPAQGKTGEQFEKCIINVCVLLQYNHKIFHNNSIYELWIVNAIQYQTSLGFKTQEYRTAIFLTAWYKFGMKSLKERLVSLISDDDIIINAVTIGNALNSNNYNKIINTFKDDEFNSQLKTNNIKTINLKKHISSFLEISFPKNKIINTSHPCLWRCFSR